MSSIYIANDSKMGRGGGVSFLTHFAKGLGRLRVQTPEEADIIFIPSASMVKRQTIQPHVGKKKIVLRVDNFLKDSRNRGTGMTRMRDFTTWADAVVFQSEWARQALTPHLPGVKATHVVLNGSDDTLFVTREKGAQKRFKRFLYVRQNDDPSKNPHMAFSKFCELAGPDDELWIVGSFPAHEVEWNFDLGNLKTKYFSSVQYEQMPDIYRQCDALLYSYFNDACSNVLNESLLSGLEVIGCYGMIETGGAPEQIKAGGRSVEQMAAEYLTLFESL